MLEFIARYWIEEMFALIVAILTWLVKQVKDRKRTSKTSNEAIMALLHDCVYKTCSTYIERGWCNVDDRENLEYLYKPYKELGGNGVCESLYNKVLALPLQEPKE